MFCLCSGKITQNSTKPILAIMENEQLHGTQSGANPNIKIRISELTEQRNNLWQRIRAAEVLDMDLFAQMDELSLQLEAYYDVTRVLKNRHDNGDLRGFQKNKFKKRNKTKCFIALL